MPERYECTACGKLTAVNTGACIACGSGLARLPRYFSQFSSETGDALDSALHHIHAPAPNSASVLVRLMVLVDEWLEADERAWARHTVHHGKLVPVLEANGEHTIAHMVRSGLLDESALLPRQQRALLHAEAQVTAIATLETALDRNSDAATTDAWWSAVRVGIHFDTELVRRVCAVRWNLLVGPYTPEAVRVQPEETPPRSQVAQQRLCAARDRARTARSARLRAAGSVSVHEDGTEDIDWALVASFERRAHDLAALHSAIELGDSAVTAKAWLRVRSVWPESVTEDLAKAGMAALRAWGGDLHATSGGERARDR